MQSDTELSQAELLLWTALKKFEILALDKYRSDVPDLAGPTKEQLVQRLTAGAPTDSALIGTKIEAPLSALLASASGRGEEKTLLIQGLVLEPLGLIIYETFGSNEAVSDTTRALCEAGTSASEAVIQQSTALIKTKIGTGETALQAFISTGAGVLKQLAGLGDGLDLYFSEPFGITFADLIGEYASELIPNCLALDMERRKVVAFLTASLMAV